MAKEKDIRPIQGQNFSTDDPTLGQLRARLYLCRRELGRVRGLPNQNDRTSKMIDQLEARESALIEQIEKQENDA